jgi:hypothetical protein
VNILDEAVKDESHSHDIPAGSPGSIVHKELSHLIPAEEWAIIRPALESMEARGLPFVMGGGFAFSAYSEHCRSTRDIDLFVRPEDREAFVEALADAGFEDYFDQKGYDRSWIYRGHRDGAIIDIIWQMANHRAYVDDKWLIGGRSVCIHGMALKVLPLEELFWAKLYVMQRDRCDWPDLLNLLYSVSHEIDWDRLLDRVGEDCELVGSVAALFRWMCPEKAGNIPDWVYLRLGLWPEAPDCAEMAEDDQDRPTMLDSRAWFA